MARHLRAAAAATLLLSLCSTANANIAPWVGPPGASSIEWLAAPAKIRHHHAQRMIAARHHRQATGARPARHRQATGKPAGSAPRQHAASRPADAAGERVAPVAALDTAHVLGALLGFPDGWADGVAGIGPRRPPAAASVRPVGGGLVRARIADGQVITVAARFVDRFVGFFRDIYERFGRIPDVGCYSPTGHQPGSLHHGGLACDVGQRERNVADRIMYHVTAIAARNGLTDGCTWHRDPRGPDCGHIDVSNVVGNYIGGRSRVAVRWSHRVRVAMHVRQHHRWWRGRYAGA